MKNARIDMRFVLALNNSKLFAWLLYKFIYSNAIRSTRYDEKYVGNIPCPDLEEVDQSVFINIVDKILKITENEDYLQNNDEKIQVKELEKQIDQMVYQLYGLTEEEIKTVEGQNSARVVTKNLSQ
jgi:adenine-specific DNA-methyltransferase